MLTEHSQVVLRKALPHLSLEPGDIGVVVHVYEKGSAYEVEFVTTSGLTIGLETLLAADVQAASPTAIPHARERAIGTPTPEGKLSATSLQSATIPGEQVDLTLAIRKLHELAYQDGDLGAEYWNSVIKLLSASESMHTELLRLQTEANSSAK